MRTISALAVATVLGSITVGIPEEEPAPVPTERAAPPGDEAALQAPAPGEAQGDPRAGQVKFKLLWKHSQRDIQNHEVVLHSAQVARTAKGVRPGAAKAEKIETAKPGDGGPGFPLTDLFDGVKPGQYSLWVRVSTKRGEREVWSDWSKPLHVAIDAQGVITELEDQVPAEAPPPAEDVRPPTREAPGETEVSEAPGPQPVEPQAIRPQPVQPVQPPPAPAPARPEKTWKRHTPTGGCG